MNKLENNIEENIDNNPLYNLRDFVRRQECIEDYMQECKFRRKNHLKLLEKVLKLEEILSKKFVINIDPIIFLHGLYYEKNLSIESIVNYIKQLYDEQVEVEYFYKNATALQKFFTQVLNWKLKDPKENKKTTTYKSREKPEALITQNKEEKEKRKAMFLSWFIKNSVIDKTNFDIEVFNNFKFKYEKFIYLLENFFHISAESYKKLLEINLGNQSFADRFNEIFNENNIDFKISHKDVARVFEKYKND
ncbi:MAG: hypothetical protein PHH98_02260 [Candidatus Gracilibacteria bacterium]|nr:hypothetical protein [Candidatus Gracilibacteria bacterium]